MTGVNQPVRPAAEQPRDDGRPREGRRRRWFLPANPIWDAERRDRRCQTWEIKDELGAAAILSDVTLDLSQARRAACRGEAHSLFHDVDVVGGEGDHVDVAVRRAQA